MENKQRMRIEKNQPYLYYLKRSPWLFLTFPWEGAILNICKSLLEFWASIALVLLYVLLLITSPVSLPVLSIMAWCNNKDKKHINKKYKKYIDNKRLHKELK